MNSLKDLIRILLKSVWRPRLHMCKTDNLPLLNILGTGPSMIDSISHIKNDKCSHVMVLNDFAYSDFYSEIQPRYYILIDPVYWRKEVHERGSNEREKLFDCLVARTNWYVDLFIPSTGYQMGLVQDKLRSNQNIKVHPINTYDIIPRVSKFYFFLLDHNLTAPTQNVLATAIVTAILMGYNKIGLHGAEHSWTEFMRVNDDNVVCTVNKHFYDEPDVLVPWIDSDGKPFKLSRLLNCFYMTFRSYEIIEKYALTKNVNIINYTPGSYIDAFERGRLK